MDLNLKDVSDHMWNTWMFIFGLLEDFQTKAL